MFDLVSFICGVTATVLFRSWLKSNEHDDYDEEDEDAEDEEFFSADPYKKTSFIKRCSHCKELCVYSAVGSQKLKYRCDNCKYTVNIQQ